MKKEIINIWSKVKIYDSYIDRTIYTTIVWIMEYWTNSEELEYVLANWKSYFWNKVIRCTEEEKNKYYSLY